MTQTELAAVIALYLDALHNLATWLTGEAAAAQALVRATCHQALEMIPQPLPGTNLQLGLLTIMWGIYGQHHRVSADGLDDQVVDQVATEKRVLFHTLSGEDLYAGLRQLPEVLRTALILTDMEGFPVDQVAEVFGWSPQKTHSAITRARQLLQSFLRVRLAALAVSPGSEEKDTL